MKNTTHIGIFGRRNTGKSALINALTGQEIAIVSDIAGTTTDPVKKSMEIPCIGPVVLIDTAGLDDTGEKAARYDDESARFRKKWETVLAAGDPYYNPNFSLDRSDFALKI